MRQRHSFVSGLAVTAVLLSLWTCGGGDSGGTAPPVLVPTFLQISNNLITLTALGETATLVVTVQDQNGDAIANPAVTFSSSNSSTASVNSAGVVTAVGNGAASITARSGAANGSANVTVDVPPLALDAGVAVTLSGSTGSQQFFTFEVPTGLGPDQHLEIRTSGGSGDVDLLLRFGSPPSLTSFDCLSALTANPALDNLDLCTVFGPAAGTWHILANGFSSFSGVELQAQFVTSTTIEDGVPQTNLSAVQNQFLYFDFTVPAPPSALSGVESNEASTGWRISRVISASGVLANNKKLESHLFQNVVGNNSSESFQALSGASSATGGILEISTTAVGGDADLFATPAGNFGGSELFVSLPCQSGQAASDEQCEVIDPIEGTWSVFIWGFAPFSGLDLLADFTSAESTGTLTINKTVESSAGLAPDNPPSPTLSGFVYRIEAVESGDLVTTLTTDASGVATAEIPIGDYTITEADAQGLTDITLEVTPLRISEGEEAVIEWTNRQQVALGTLTIQKSIESATGGPPDSPPNPSLDGFIFEVREPGTGRVIHRLTTDPSGTASVTLPAATYDVVESSPQGLTDLTGDMDGVVLSADAPTVLDWINRQSATPTGTITIQKTIESSTGGLADHPADPDLAGFVFGVNEAGTGKRVATVTTDENGQAVIAVQGGTYDIVEDDAQSLVDHTSSVNGVVAVGGTDTPVAYTNRQTPLGSGVLSIQKTIESADGGVPGNPANPALDGFVFQVKDALTSQVVALLTTDENGRASTTLSTGGHEVSEVNSQGLIDFTGDQADVVVLDATEVVVPWINRQHVALNQAPVALIVPPNPASIPVGDGNSTIVTLIGASSFDPDGSPLQFEWTVQGGTFVLGTEASDPVVYVTFPGVGDYDVSLTVTDGVASSEPTSTQVQLLNPLPPEGFQIDFEVLGDLPASVNEAMTAAVERWSEVITGELEDVVLTGNAFIPANVCSPFVSPEIREDVLDDIRIFVSTAGNLGDGPNGFLAAAAPCLTRVSDGSPVVGVVIVDPADVDSPLLSAVMIHELGHVLGIGTLWGNRSLLVNPSITSQALGVPPLDNGRTHYRGGNAISQFDMVGGGPFRGSKVPVEDEVGGAGAQDGHWRESVLRNELMTGFLSPGEALSTITIGALMDLGYIVDLAAADLYAVPDVLLAPPVLGPGIWLGDDVLKLDAEPLRIGPSGALYRGPTGGDGR